MGTENDRKGNRISKRIQDDLKQISMNPSGIICEMFEPPFSPKQNASKLKGFGAFFFIRTAAGRNSVL